MDETSATPEAASALDGRRRRLLFRANHRGTRENDILVGGFVTARIARFTEQEIARLEVIMEMPDPLLAEWLTGRAPLPAEHEEPVLRAMVDARGK